MYADKSVSLKKEYPEMYELLGALRSNYVTDEDCYVVVIRDQSYILPKGQEELAQAVIAKGSGYASGNLYDSEEALRVIGAGSDLPSPGMVWSDNDGWMDESGNWHAWDEEWSEYEEIWN